VPLADDLYSNSTLCKVLKEDTVRAEQTAQTLPTLETRIDAMSQELAALDARAVDEESVAAYRSKLVDMARSTGCQIRRIDVGQAVKRPWHENQDVLERTKPTKLVKTPFFLERRTVTLVVDGTMQEIKELLTGLEAEQTFAHTRTLRLQSGARNGNVVGMELELWLFDLTRS
jgi:hypothetical protein